MLDRYISGKVRRVSPEAPVPVLDPDARWSVPGGAANVALNIAGLGAKVGLICALGPDDASRELADQLATNEVSLYPIMTSRSIPVKTRVRTEIQHLIRIDEETSDPLGLNDGLMKILSEVLHSSDYNVLLLSDYSKGLLNDELISEIISFAQSSGCMVVTDPKKSNPSAYLNTFLIKPNLEEAKALTGWSRDIQDVDDLISLSQLVLEKTKAQNVITTGGSLGSVLASPDQTVHFEASHQLPIRDVSGAGDTFISYVSAGLSVGDPIDLCCELATFAASVSCASVGTRSVSVKDVLSAWLESNNRSIHKVISDEEIEAVVAMLPRPIVFTNGCFDVLHPGHIASLEFARNLGASLIVGVNTDESVRQLKGPSRPLQDVNTRMRILGALSSTTAICQFSSDTPLELIQRIVPDVLVKGDEYNLNEVVGREIVESNGGRIVLMERVPGFSTTDFAKSLLDKT